MNSLRLLILIAVILTCSSAAAFDAALSEELREVSLRADGVVVLRPGEQISLKFELREGKLVNPKTLPIGSKEPETVTLWIKRTGGKRTVLGPVSPVRDFLSIRSTLPGLVTVRCTYSSAKLARPKTIPSARDGRSFNAPIVEAILTDFVLEKQ